jgi:DNA-binding beta-propeller fold protein YncE
VFGDLTITQDNASIIGLAVVMAEGTLSIAQTAANEVVVFSTSSGVASRQCEFDGTATITHNDVDNSFSVSAGDTLMIEYDECYGDLVDGEMTGMIEIVVTDYLVSTTTVNLSASVDIAGSLRIADRVDPTLFSDVAAGFDIVFSLDPSENLAVSSDATDEVSISASGTTEAISNFDMSRVTQAAFPGAESHEVDMDIAFDLFLDSELFGGTVTCQTDDVFAFVRGLIVGADVLCRGRNATAVNSRGQDLVNIDPEGDGTFTPLGTIEWNQVIDGFLNKPSGLNLDDLSGQIATNTISIATTDVVYDSARDRLLVATSGTDSSAASALVSVSLSQNTRAVLATFTQEPSAVALSADGALIYVGFTGGGEIRKYDAATLQLLSTVNIVSNDPASNQFSVLGLAVSPVAPHTVAASFNYVGTAVDDITVFVDDVQLPGRVRNAPGFNPTAGEKLFFSADGTRIHSFFQPPPANTGALDIVVDASGVVEVFSNFRFGPDLELAEGRFYSAGYEFDAETYVRLGSFGQAARHIAVDTVNRRYYSESFDTFQIWDLDRRLPVATYQLGLEFDSVNRIEVAGSHLVFVRDNDLRLLDTTIIEPVADRNCDATAAQTTEGDAYTQYACDVIDAIYSPSADRIYAAVTADVPGSGNSVAVINPNTETVENYIPVPSNPKRLVLSADGSRLYVAFAEVELLVAIDTTSQTVIDTWQLGIVTPRNGYNEISPRRVRHFAASPLEPNTIVALTSEEASTIDSEFVAFRDGVRLADEVPISALKSNSSNPYPRIVFDDNGSLYALHSDGTVPYFETLLLSPTGLTPTNTWFDAISAIWFPFEVSVKGSEVFFAIGDVANIANQTVERRFDYNILPFSAVNAPNTAYADPDSDDVWFLTQSSFDSTGLARFNGQDGSLTGTDEFPFLIRGRNADFSHASIFNVGGSRIGLVIDEREGVFVVDKAAIE